MLLFSGQVGHGANMTCESIDIALRHLDTKYACLPSKIYIQLDNCNDNKCATVLAYLYDLVRRGCLRNVKACMLIVGHTHIDIDQWFGVFSRALTRHEALSFPSYERVLKDAFALERNAPHDIRFVELVHDWDSYYARALDPNLKRYTGPKCFTFKLDSLGAARLFYKDFMISKEERPRPHQPGTMYVPRTEAEGAKVFGALWAACSESDKQRIMTEGVKCGDATFERTSRLWHTELKCGAGLNITVSAPSPGIRLLLSEPHGEPAIAATPLKWYVRLLLTVLFECQLCSFGLGTVRLMVT